MKNSTARTTLFVLLGINVVLIAAFLAVKFATSGVELEGWREKVARLFDVGFEPAIPTWFSTIQLAGAAVLAIIVARRLRAGGQRFSAHWWGIAIIFAYLSLDEAAQIHEIAVEPVKALLNISEGPLSSAWVIPFGLLAIAIGLVYLRFVFSLPRATAWGFVVAAVVFVGGSIGMEILDTGIGTEDLRALYGTENVRTVLHAFEEFFEMAGVSVFIFAVLGYLARPETFASTPATEASETTEGTSAEPDHTLTQV
jgi:hypothetical protein